LQSNLYVEKISTGPEKAQIIDAEKIVKV